MNTTTAIPITSHMQVDRSDDSLKLLELIVVILFLLTRFRAKNPARVNTLMVGT